MRWTLNEPLRGDIVRIQLGSIYHFGIYVSDDEIIQFGLPPTSLNRDASKVEVCSTNLETFLCGKFLEVGVPEKKEKKQILPKEKIVEIAKSRIGEKGYHILYNNCEHFVFQCAFNKKVSQQVEEVRSMFRKFPFVDVFVEKFPFKTKNNSIFPIERLEEIKNCGSKDVQIEKFYSWKLLEHAFMQSLGLEINNIKFEKQNGKWTSSEACFSISHSSNIVAVVVARNAVGIDIEEINLERFNALPPEKILTTEELANIQVCASKLNSLWTVKEALFKKNDGKNFLPCKISSLDKKYLTKIVIVNNEEFFLTVATDDLSFVKFHFGEGISLKK